MEFVSQQVEIPVNKLMSNQNEMNNDSSEDIMSQLNRASEMFENINITPEFIMESSVSPKTSPQSPQSAQVTKQPLSPNSAEPISVSRSRTPSPVTQRMPSPITSRTPSPPQKPPSPTMKTPPPIMKTPSPTQRVVSLISSSQSELPVGSMITELSQAISPSKQQRSPTVAVISEQISGQCEVNPQTGSMECETVEGTLKTIFCEMNENGELVCEEKELPIQPNKEKHTLLFETPQSPSVSTPIPTIVERPSSKTTQTPESFIIHPSPPSGGIQETVYSPRQSSIISPTKQQQITPLGSPKSGRSSPTSMFQPVSPIKKNSPHDIAKTYSSPQSSLGSSQAITAQDYMMTQNNNPMSNVVIVDSNRESPLFNKSNYSRKSESPSYDDYASKNYATPNPLMSAMTTNTPRQQINDGNYYSSNSRHDDFKLRDFPQSDSVLYTTLERRSTSPQQQGGQQQTFKLWQKRSPQQQTTYRDLSSPQQQQQQQQQQQHVLSTAGTRPPHPYGSYSNNDYVTASMTMQTCVEKPSPQGTPTYMCEEKTVDITPKDVQSFLEKERSVVINDKILKLQELDKILENARRQGSKVLKLPDSSELLSTIDLERVKDLARGGGVVFNVTPIQQFYNNTSPNQTPNSPTIQSDYHIDYVSAIPRSQESPYQTNRNLPIQDYGGKMYYQQVESPISSNMSSDRNTYENEVAFSPASWEEFYVQQFNSYGDIVSKCIMQQQFKTGTDIRPENILFCLSRGINTIGNQLQPGMYPMGLDIEIVNDLLNMGNTGQKYRSQYTQIVETLARKYQVPQRQIERFVLPWIMSKQTSFSIDDIENIHNYVNRGVNLGTVANQLYQQYASGTKPYNQEHVPIHHFMKMQTFEDRLHMIEPSILHKITQVIPIDGARCRAMARESGRLPTRVSAREIQSGQPLIVPMYEAIGESLQQGKTLPQADIILVA